MSTVNIVQKFPYSGPQIWIIDKKRPLKKVAGESFQVSKIQNSESNRLKHALKGFQGSTLDFP